MLDKKRCWKCKNTKDKDCFSKDKSRWDGLQPRCKQCEADYRKSNAAHKRDYRRDYYLKNKDEILLKTLEYSKNHPGVVLKASATYRLNNPEKKKAHYMLNDAVRRGQITRPKICPQCGTKGRINAHHKDYSRPLEVKWMCHKCHKLLHHFQKEMGLNHKKQQSG